MFEQLKRLLFAINTINIENNTLYITTILVDEHYFIIIWVTFSYFELQYLFGSEKLYLIIIKMQKSPVIRLTLEPDHLNPLTKRVDRRKTI